MLAHGDKQLESLLLNVGSRDWREQVEAKAVDILSMVSLHFAGMYTGCTSIWAYCQSSM